MIKNVIVSIYKSYSFIKRNTFNKLYYILVTNQKNKNTNISNIRNVIIVAHPDDEIIFFHQFLQNNRNTLVICLTNGGSRTRSNEFFKSLKFYQNTGLIYNFKDGLDVEWDYKELSSQLRKVLVCTRVKIILTHNQKGEYGHPNHITCHKIVKNIQKNEFPHVKFLTPELNYRLFHEQNKITIKELNKKKAIFKLIYKSQSNGILNKNLIYYKYIEFEKLVYL